MQSDRGLIDFLEQVNIHNDRKLIRGLTFCKPRLVPKVIPDIKRIGGRYVQLQSGLALQLHYRYSTRDEFKNIHLKDVVRAATDIINQKVFKEAILLTPDMQYKLVTRLSPGSNEQSYHLNSRPAEPQSSTANSIASLQHDRTKETLLSMEEPFLQLLGVTTSTPRSPEHSIDHTSDLPNQQRDRRRGWPTNSGRSRSSPRLCTT